MFCRSSTVTSYWREDKWLTVIGGKVLDYQLLERRYIVSSYWREDDTWLLVTGKKIHGYQLLEKSNRITTFWVEKSASSMLMIFIRKECTHFCVGRYF